MRAVSMPIRKLIRVEPGRVQQFRLPVLVLCCLALGSGCTFLERNPEDGDPNPELIIYAIDVTPSSLNFVAEVVRPLQHAAPASIEPSQGQSVSVTLTCAKRGQGGKPEPLDSKVCEESLPWGVIGRGKVLPVLGFKGVAEVANPLVLPATRFYPDRPSPAAYRRATASSLGQADIGGLRLYFQFFPKNPRPNSTVRGGTLVLDVTFTAKGKPIPGRILNQRLPCAISATSIVNFGPTSKDTTSTGRLTIRNRGGETVNVKDLDFFSGESVFGWHGGSPSPSPPFTLGPGRSVTLGLTFQPLQSGMHTGTIFITAQCLTSPDEGVEARLRGQGIGF